MSGFWVNFNEGGSGYCDGKTEDSAKQKAEEVSGKTVKAIKTLPYPAKPIIWQEEREYGYCPAFCYRPNICAGNTSCPTNPSCTN